MDTSRDKVSDDLMSLIDRCCEGFFQQNHNSTSTTTSNSKLSKSSLAPPPRTNAVKSQTLGKKFKVQLESLLNVLTTTRPHYIKCVKPNTMKVPNCFQGMTCFSQLQALGIFEAVSIRKRGYPCRMTHEDFFRTYGALFKQQLIARGGNNLSLKVKCEIIMNELNKRSGHDPIYHFLLGKTKIFSKFEARESANKLLDKYKIKCVIRIQSVIRRVSTRISFDEFCNAAIQANNLLSVEDPQNEAYLPLVNTTLLKLEKYPYQHYIRLNEMKVTII